MVEPDRFRAVMGHFVTGVTIVTTRDGEGRPLGLTVNAFSSLSLDPVLILVAIHRDAGPHDVLVGGSSFAVSVLAGDQAELAIHFTRGPAEDRFRDLPVREAPMGNPLVPGALAWLECAVREVFPGGDHSIVVGEVASCGAREGEALLFFRGELRGMTS